MKYIIICVMLSLFPLVEGESLAEVTCEGSPAEDNRAGRKKVRKWDNCQGIQFHHYRKNEFKYDGFFIKGERTGQGIQEVLSPNEFVGEKYIGEFKDGKRNGQGILTLATGEEYIGNSRDDERNGQGKNTWPNGDFLEGYFENDALINGFMDSTLDDGSHYVGEWKNGKGDGQGTHTLVNGQKYVGEFKDNNYHGQGKFTWPNGEYFEGYFENNILINGVMDGVLDDGSRYTGEIKNGKLFDGFFDGALDDGTRYIGYLRNTRPDGQGTKYFSNGTMQEGVWKNGHFQYVQRIDTSPTIAREEPENNDEGSTKPNNQIPDDKEITASSGSGFAVSEDGYIITNNHVVDQCQSVVIHFEGEEIPATVVSYDTKNDLALLKGDFSPQTVFPLSINRPELLQDVYVAGYPFGVYPVKAYETI